MTDPEQLSFEGIATTEVGPEKDQEAQGRVTASQASQILTKGNGFLSEYDFSLNPYSGCRFGCTYCYAAFFNRNAELRDTWGEWVRIKSNAAELMAKRRKGSLNGKRIYMSSVTDPYQPVERSYKITQRVLKALKENHRPKLVVQTRSPLVERDSELFREIVDNGGNVQVNMTLTTDDEEVRQIFEPSCPPGEARLQAIENIHKAGIDTCITLTPLLLVNDRERFAERLLSTGVTKFVGHWFQFSRGGFVANTREDAVNLMAAKLGRNPDDFLQEYRRHYEEFFSYFNDELSKRRYPALGKDKDGFRPPF